MLMLQTLVFLPQGLKEEDKAKMKKIFILVIIILCLGCSHQRVWTKPDYKTDADFPNDIAECQAQSKVRKGGVFMFGPGVVLIPFIVGLEVYDRVSTNWFVYCMQTKGYVLHE